MKNNRELIKFKIEAKHRSGTVEVCYVSSFITSERGKKRAMKRHLDNIMTRPNCSIVEASIDVVER